MLKKLKGFIGLTAFILLVSSFFGSSAMAATVGEPLLAAEQGWHRIDDKDSRIVYSGNQWTTTTGPQFYGNSLHYLPNNPTNSSQTVKFSFYGTQLRIISTLYQDYTSNLVITIDGVDYAPVSVTGPSVQINQALVFEVADLVSKEHTVQIKSTDTKRWVLDAIDIDDTGYLINPNLASPILKAEPVVSKIDLSWNTVNGATSYNVKRSLSADGPYETIATVNSTNYSDSNVTEGTTYYYKITAVNSVGEGASSNEVSASLLIIRERALLTITLNTGLEKEFDLSMPQVNAFINWYETKASGNGPVMFAVDKGKNNIGPFKSRKDYIIFDRILTFEVNEYVPTTTE
ncbi:fibronectin type III domain-containing protein [Paenibacillus polysaccharolyticus]|nr:MULTISPECIES: fibronectin type III domain-containing protein [Paenibacillus]